ncbi:polyribonucleotide nucleotidyltransferase [soil metagenome]
MTIPQAKRYSTTLGGRELSLETGKYAKLASGSVTLRYGETVVLVTAQMSTSGSPLDFLPLTVEYEERHYAIGKIPGSFLRREGRPGSQATLNARLTDRQIRPLFPKDLRNEVQVLITVLSADQQNDPAPLAAIGASAALMMSNAPLDGPTACVNVGYIGGEYVLNPTFQEMEASALELTVAGSREAVLMVEASANELSESVMVGAIEFAHQEMQGILGLIERLAAETGKEKTEYSPATAISAEDVDLMYREATARGLRDILRVPAKQERSIRQKELRDTIIADKVPDAEAEGAGERITVLKEVFSKAAAREARRLVLEDNVRADGRAPKDIRPIWIETSVLPMAHGSAVFTRGETQVLGVTTLGTRKDNRLVDDLGLEGTEDFMLHYNFPPFSTGEVKRLRGVSRREVGHGNLARRALENVIPSQDDFPYTIRIVGEVLESNGSSSMATVCAGCLSLMDAGVPIKKPVAGIAMGLVKEEGRHAILSDILGSEDAIGDMDFKVTGSRDGVTALQMDIKIRGITAELMREALEQAKTGRVHILDEMSKVMAEPRGELAPKAPRIMTVKIAQEKIGTVIGPGGKQIRELEAMGAQIDVGEDGTIRVYSADGEAAEAVAQRIRELTLEAEVGAIYEGTVAKVLDFGAFITLFPGTDGLLHISQIAEGRVDNVDEHLKVGDRVRVKVNTIDARGKLDLIRPELEGKIPPRRPAEGRGGGDRGGDRGPRDRGRDRGPRDRR